MKCCLKYLFRFKNNLFKNILVTQEYIANFLKKIQTLRSMKNKCGAP